ncbi:MAG TPA: hypothetical protein VJ806_14095 [Luteimonas sp.]|nr:hypothetical protein [Luteimonas sp.]
MLKKLFAIVLIFLSSSSACAGPYYFDSYMPFSKRWSYVMPPGAAFASGQWATWSADATNMTIHWTSDSSTTAFNWNALASVEKFEIRPNCADGAAWVFLNGYRHNTNPNIIFWLKTDKALVRVAGATVYDETHITRQGACAKFLSSVGPNGDYIGIPYAPYVFWDQTYEFEIWGKIADANGALVRSFYWKALYQPGIAANNPCWLGSAPSRLTILQQEAYWDSIAGWSVGSGTVDMANLTASNVKYGRYQRYGENAGPGWTTGTVSATGTLSPPTGCLQNVWAY